MATVAMQAKIEKASIDEMYVDVTALVEKELAVRSAACKAFAITYT